MRESPTEAVNNLSPITQAHAQVVPIPRRWVSSLALDAIVSLVTWMAWLIAVDDSQSLN